MKKLSWLLGILVIWVTVTALVDRRRAVRRRQLWAEATRER